MPQLRKARAVDYVTTTTEAVDVAHVSNMVGLESAARRSCTSRLGGATSLEEARDKLSIITDRCMPRDRDGRWRRAFGIMQPSSVRQRCHSATICPALDGLDDFDA